MKFTKNLKFALRAIFMQANNISTDKGTLLYDGELGVGAEVFVEIADEDGNVEYVAPENGEYTLEDGKVLVVTDGKIEEIKEPEVEETMSANVPVEENVEVKTTFAKTAHDKIIAQFEATYQEIENNIYNAIRNKGIDGYIIENTNEYVVVNVYDYNYNSTLIRYEITIDENGEVTIGEATEVKEVYVEVEETFAAEDVVEPAAEPVEDNVIEPNSLEDRIAALETQVAQFTEGIEKIVNLVSGFETRVAEIEEKVAKLDETPAAEPVEEEVAQSKNILSYLK